MEYYNMEFVQCVKTDNKKIPFIVHFNGKSTPVWIQQLWEEGEYQEFIRKNGCGHCCTAMALNLNGVKTDPHLEFALCRKLWGEPKKDIEIPQDNFQTVAGITKIIKHYGIAANYYGVSDYELAKKTFIRILKEGKQIIFWSQPKPDFPENPFSKYDHYVMAVGYYDTERIVVANSSLNGQPVGVELVHIDTIIKSLYFGSEPTEKTWGERSQYKHCAGYVVVG